MTRGELSKNQIPRAEHFVLNYNVLVTENQNYIFPLKLHNLIYICKHVLDFLPCINQFIDSSL